MQTVVGNTTHHAQEALLSLFAQEGDNDDSDGEPARPRRRRTEERPKRFRTQETVIDDVPSAIVDAISTYDKGARGEAPAEKRARALSDRVSRSREKVRSAALSEQQQPDPEMRVDPTFMQDATGQTLAKYDAHVRFATSETRRSEQPPPPSSERRSEKPPRPRVLVAPGTRPVDMDGTMSVHTFEERRGGLDPRRGVFETNMRHVTGSDSGMSVAVRPPEEIYQNVTGVMERSLAGQQIARYAIHEQLHLPVLPVVPRAVIQEALQSPDYEMGERPCAWGNKCSSYLLSCELKRQNPSRYASVDPFPCKEFYFGPQGDQMREALASGTPLSELQSHEPVLCVMCHFSIVTAYYKTYDLEVASSPVHILHSFQCICGVPGEYAMEKMLLGDKTFKGIIAPFIRFVPDNYMWIPSPPRTESKRDPATGVTRRVSVPAAVQRWTEVPGMDFH